LGARRALRRNPGPVLLPWGALLDPAADLVDFAGVQVVTRGDRRPPHFRIARRDAAHHLTPGRIHGDDRKSPFPQVLLGSRLGVEAQLRQAILTVGPWQVKQLSERRGRMSRLNWTTSAPASGSALCQLDALEVPVPRRRLPS
jgi:hypothetical protein